LPGYLTSVQTEDATLDQWIAHVFDHPVTDPQWYWETDAPDLDPGPEQTCLLIAESFERGGGLLAPFSDAQLNQGFWYLAGCGSDYMHALCQSSATLPVKLRALRSIVPLFEQVMAVRCSPHLSHLDEQPANPLNSACYMWWDVISFPGTPEDPAYAPFDAEVLSVMQRILAIPHDACRESALHGLGHWQSDYPQTTEIIDRFLQQSHGLRRELVAYAENAKIGYIQ